MKKTILLIVLLSVSAAFGHEKEGYSKYFEVPFEETVELLTVPENKTFVLRKLYVSGASLWQINRDGELLLNNMIGQGEHDFPDYCVTVGPGKTLEARDTSTLLKITLIGYFYTPVSNGPDLNGDGIVNFEDFAIMANRWLEIN